MLPYKATAGPGTSGTSRTCSNWQHNVRLATCPSISVKLPGSAAVVACPAANSNNGNTPVVGDLSAPAQAGTPAGAGAAAALSRPTTATTTAPAREHVAVPAAAPAAVASPGAGAQQRGLGHAAAAGVHLQTPAAAHRTAPPATPPAPPAASAPPAAPATHAPATGLPSLDEYETEYEYVTESEESDQAASSPPEANQASQALVHAGALKASGGKAAAAGRAAGAAQQLQPTASLMASASPHMLSPDMQTKVSGWVVAACLLLAARLSRDEADIERQDLRALQVRQAESRVQSVELRARRRVFLEQERIKKEQEAAKRLEEAKKRAEEEAATKVAREAAYREAAAKETARLWAEQQAAREEFLAAEAQLAEELVKRTAVEVALREAEEKKKKEREEQLRREYEEQQRKRAEEEARRAEEARQQAAAAEAARQADRRRLQAALTRYTMILDGTATVQTAPPGMLTTESSQPGWQRGAKVARLSMQLSLQLASTHCNLPADAADASSSGSGGNSSSPPSVPSGDAASSPAPTAVGSSIAARFGLAASGSGAAGQGDRPVGRPAAWVLPVNPADTRVQQQAAYASATDAEEGASVLAGTVARPLLEQLWTHMHETSTGSSSSGGSSQSLPAAPAPGLLMGNVELRHWRRLGAACCAVAASRAVAQVAPLAERQPLDQPFQVCLVRAALPKGHAASAATRMDTAAAALLRGDLQEVVVQVNSVLEEEQDMLVSSGALASWWAHASSPAPPVALPPLTLHCLTYALLLDTALTPSNSSSSSSSSPPANLSAASSAAPATEAAAAAGTTAPHTAPASSAAVTNSDDDMFAGPSSSEDRSSDSDAADSGVRGGATGEAVRAGVHESGEVTQQVAQLARYQLGLAAKRLPADSLQPTAACVREALGASHPLTRVMCELAEANMSDTMRAKLEAKQRQAELEEAAAQLQAQEQQFASLSPNDPTSRQALVPVPERLWAVRNVAGSMVRFGEPSQVDEALGMLQGACNLAAEHYGTHHPSCADVLLDYRDALQAVLPKLGEDEEAAAQRQRLQARIKEVTAQLVDVVKGIGERYLEQEDVLSAVLLFDSTVKELGPVSPTTSPPSLVALQREAAELVYQLSPTQARAAVAKRNANARTSLLRSLAQEFREQLGVYSTPSRITRLQQWQQGVPLAPLR